MRKGLNKFSERASQKRALLQLAKHSEKLTRQAPLSQKKCVQLSKVRAKRFGA
jgi:hypothetical protein